eukprot:gene1621-4756_t
MSSTFEEIFHDYEGDGHFALMGSDLMGGAPLPPLTPKQKQTYIDGIGIKAKYIGSIQVASPHGSAKIFDDIERVRAAHKQQHEAKSRTWLVISVSGLKIRDFDTRALRDSYSLHQVSYVTWLPSNGKVFAFITSTATVHTPIYKCHVYKSNSKSKMITETFGRCFTLAFEMQRTGIHRAVHLNSLDFHEVVNEMNKQLQTSRVPLDISSFCQAGFKRLIYLYDVNAHRNHSLSLTKVRHPTSSSPAQQSVALPKSKARTRSYRINNQVLTEELAHDPTGTTQENVLDDSNPFSPKSMQNKVKFYSNSAVGPITKWGTMISHPLVSKTKVDALCP